MECDGKKCGQGVRVGNVYVCPHNNLEVKFPELVSEWSPDNEKRMSEYLPGTAQKARWICSKNPCGDHIWTSFINSRTGLKPKGCPFCSNRRVCAHNNLKVMHPHLIEQWHPDNPPMDTFSQNSSEVVLWICPKNPCGCHIYLARISNRTRINPTICPYCNGKKICAHNNLEFLYPELKKEWDSDNPKPMNEYAPHSDAKIKWKCSNVNDCECHIWETSILCRTGPNKTGCPYCNHNKACIHNNLEINNPELKNEWHPDNPKFMNEYTSGIHTKVKWICKNNNQHIWETRISSRTSKGTTGCPYCNNKTEGKLFEYLTVNYDYDIETQKLIDGCESKNNKPLKFDFCIEELKLIIELDGPQHFIQISNWYDPILTQKNDKYKMKCANDNGYSVIRLLQEDVWNDTNNWKNNLKKSIKKYDIPTNLFFGDCYDNYKVIDEVSDVVSDEEIIDEMIDEVYNTKKIVKPIVDSNIKRVVKAAPKSKPIITTNNKRIVKVVPTSSVKTTSKTNNGSDKVRTISKNE